MIFRRNKEAESFTPEAKNATTLYIIANKEIISDQLFHNQLISALPHLDIQFVEASKISSAQFANAIALVSIFNETEVLQKLLELNNRERELRKDGLPPLIVAVNLQQLTMLGNWLYLSATQDSLHGIRLIATSDITDIPQKISDKLGPIFEPNTIKMPASTEVDCKDFKYIYTITPELRRVVRTMKELAENGITRVYLLGGPGSGKTSLAYYYWLCRKRGNFVSVNLNAESTENKEAMKSLLCGHVSGSIAGAGSREGALSYAADGVCFLDESHGVTGLVMQVLSEVLDSGQFLPFGATKKRSLDCAVIFASNRSWETLRNLVNLDDHARLGATIITLNDLSTREEDLIAVLATTLAKFSKQCTSWKPPQGVSVDAWGLYKSCPWHGNTRTLIRVTETALVSCATQGTLTRLIEDTHVAEGISLWEPNDHESLKLYTSFKNA